MAVRGFDQQVQRVGESRIGDQLFKRFEGLRGEQGSQLIGMIRQAVDRTLSRRPEFIGAKRTTLRNSGLNRLRGNILPGFRDLRDLLHQRTLVVFGRVGHGNNCLVLGVLRSTWPKRKHAFEGDA